MYEIFFARGLYSVNFPRFQPVVNRSRIKRPSISTIASCSSAHAGRSAAMSSGECSGSAVNLDWLERRGGLSFAVQITTVAGNSYRYYQ